MQKKYKIVISAKARADFRRIVLYIKDELNEPIIAKRYEKVIKKEIKSLENMPQRYATIDDDMLKDLNMRKLIIKNHIAFYRIDEDKSIVSVERILLGTSNWKNELE